tara:strand:+ start:483 stop:668 length:186 start_codon:yes stop_codon:yes gene_type:complete
MTEPPFDTEAYRNYTERLDVYLKKEPNELIESIKKLGFKLDQQLDKIISQLDRILEDDETS